MSKEPDAFNLKIGQSMTSYLSKASSALRDNTFGENLIRIFSKIITPFTQNSYKDHAGPDLDLARGSEIGELFIKHNENPISKWSHYLEIYEDHLKNLRGSKVRVLEIGVAQGGSLDLWRNYFGSDAVIFGVDIQEKCAVFDGVSGSVRIGSQKDKGFLRQVVQEMGGVDVIIDDGSHDSLHISRSFDALFPLLSDGGKYIVEDLHCAYWPVFSGGYHAPWSFVNRARRMIHDINHRYHGKGQKDKSINKDIRAIHFYDSVIVFDKRSSPAPQMLRRP